MNRENIEALLALAEAGTVQGAAESLHIPRTTVRRRLAKLEEQVGAPLTHRGPDGVGLTSAGEVIVAQSRAILHRFDAMVADARTSMSQASGVIRMIMPIGLPKAPRILALLNLTRVNPKLRLEVREVPNPLDELETPFELLLYFGAPPSTGPYFSRTLRRVPVRLVASPEYLQRRAPACVQDLAEHRILAWLNPSLAPGGLPLREGGTAQCQPWLASPNLSLLRAIASKEGGLVLAPDLGVPEDPDIGTLVPVLDDLVGSELSFGALSPRPSAVNSKVREVVENIQRLIDQVSVTS